MNNPIDGLKIRTVNMFDDFIKRMHIGYIDDYQQILINISFIENCDRFDKVTSIYEKLMAYEQ